MRYHVDPKAPRVESEEQFSLEGWIDSAPFEVLLGLKIVQAADGEALLELPFLVELANGGGVMHGGALVTLADTAVAMAIKSLLPEGTVFATTDLQMEFCAPVMSGTVFARARVTGPQGRTFLGKAELCDADGKTFARFSSTFRVARGQGFED